MVGKGVILSEIRHLSRLCACSFPTMPTFCSSSAVRTSTGQFSLSLRARHILVAGDPSDTVRTVKGRLPEGVDVILDSDLVITLSGLVDAVKVPGHVIQRSAVARHVLDHLRTNAGQLGLGAISKLYVDEDDGRAKFSLSSSRPLRATTEMACFRLVSIDVVLSCRMIVRGGESSPEAASLFSGQAYLPLSSALDSVLEKFIANDLVRRYPLIFGPWREKLDLEARVFPSLSRSLMDVARSSSDPSFKKRFQRLVATLGTRHASRVRCVNQAVRDCLGDNAVDEAHRPVIQEGFDILKRSLDTLFRRGVRPATFKALSATTQGAYDEDEDDYMFDLSEGASNRDVIIPWPGSSDEDLIELDSGEDNDEPWVTADCSLFLDETGCPEEDDSDCIVLSDEESGHQGLPRSHNSTSLDCGALVLASRTALLVADAGEEDETWLPQSNGHALLASSRGTQSLGSDDDAIVRCLESHALVLHGTPY
ncbi:uncharacterized protein C8Q71DRAFT_333494 [Rhodofomes roseus]|uniref:Uncharacterized protein n=1 Tax=Rhodofomes roseus TaxID=34475 RepID=A0ABQ8KTU6_9APHY|nr:uncharacterized protein C8Q71DRAFT_333494 [Rhodofomes roseus]KAH9841511.1 hypothetical protein C8Q71DRAFT_333494 [Rhodofomes roseus]